VLLMVLLAGLAACSDGLRTNPAFTGRTVGVSGDGRQSATLSVVSGANTVTIRSADLGGQLVRAWTPDGSDMFPAANVDGDSVRVSLHGSGQADLHIDLNRSVTWRLRLDGGATEQNLDLRAGRLAGLDFAAGSARIDAALPSPRGTVPVRMAGGASVFAVHLPSDIPAQVLIGGGAGQATIDGSTRTGIAGGTTLATGNWPAATDRYDLNLVAGVSALTLDRGP
jgi:hypothetical protein